MKNMSKSSLIAIFVVSILAILALVFDSQVMSLTKSALENGYIKSGMILAVVIVVVSHSIMIKENSNSPLVMKFGIKPLDAFLTIGTYSAISSTACSLLEGAFIQFFFETPIYFTRFQSLDLFVLLGVSALLLWYVIFHLYLLTKEFLFITEATNFEQSSA